MHQFPPRRRKQVSKPQGRRRKQVSKPQGQKFLAAARDWKMAADLIEALHFPHHTTHCDMVWHSQARHHCGADCTMGGEQGRSLREEETLVRETTHGMRRQRMGLSSDAHRGWLSWLHRSSNNLIPDQVWINKLYIRKLTTIFPIYDITKIYLWA